MAQMASFSDRNRATRERLEDYALDTEVRTPGGLLLHIVLVCDGAGGGEVGELAARVTARTILEYMEISNEKSIPRLLVGAVEEANRVVYSELRGAGTSTVALAAVDLNDHPPYGRLYLASVGDSCIYLMRDGKLVRLNTDHVLANEYVIAGQMTSKEAERLGDGDQLTRAIGINPDVQVDIGFYAERGKDFVSSQRAFRIGQQGMLLKEGDTIFAASDGLFTINQEDSKSFIHPEEFLRHALDDDVERATRSLMGYALERHPEDNIALSMLFVPSRKRRAVQIGGGLNRQQKAGLGISFSLVVLVMIVFGVLLNQSSAETRALKATQTRQAEAIAMQKTIAAAPPTALPTLKPTNTPTATPTLSPTPKPTSTPEVAVAGQLGNQYFEDGSQKRVMQWYDINDAVISYLGIHGLEPHVDRLAYMFLQENTDIHFVRVNNTPDEERIQIILRPGVDTDSDMFAKLGQYENGGMQVTLSTDEDIKFDSKSLCMAARYIPPVVEDETQKVSFSCYSSEEKKCTYEFSSEEKEFMPPSSRVVLDVDKHEMVGEPGPILYEDVLRYYQTMVRLLGEGVAMNEATCIQPYIDSDGDWVLNDQDQCPDSPGTAATNGCPDSDGDGVPDTVDRCPGLPGLLEDNGCPKDTDGDNVPDDSDLCPNEAGPLANSGCPIDSDGDGIGDNLDECPDEFGPLDNKGCPYPDAAVPSYGGLMIDPFVVREMQHERDGQRTTMLVSFGIFFGFAGMLGLGVRRQRNSEDTDESD